MFAKNPDLFNTAQLHSKKWSVLSIAPSMLKSTSTGLPSPSTGTTIKWLAARLCKGYAWGLLEASELSLQPGTTIARFRRTWQFAVACHCDAFVPTMDWLDYLDYKARFKSKAACHSLPEVFQRAWGLQGWDCLWSAGIVGLDQHLPLKTAGCAAHLPVLLWQSMEKVKLTT